MGMRDFLKGKMKETTQNFQSRVLAAAGTERWNVQPDRENDFVWQPIPEMSDEFNGPANLSKWEFYNRGWKGRAPGFFLEKNVEVSGGALRLTARVEDPPPGCPPEYKGFTTAFVRTKHKQLYGYFEILCKAMDAQTSSSFWFASNEGPNGWWTEIDVFEYGNAGPHANRFSMNAHIFHDGPGGNIKSCISHPQHIQLPFRMCDRVMKVALDWTPQYLRWILDDRVVRTLPNKYWHRPLALQFDSETMGHLGIPSKNDPRFPATFEIYYVRSFKRVPRNQSG